MDDFDELEADRSGWMKACERVFFTCGITYSFRVEVVPEDIVNGTLCVLCDYEVPITQKFFFCV